MVGVDNGLKGDEVFDWFLVCDEVNGFGLERGDWFVSVVDFGWLFIFGFVEGDGELGWVNGFVCCEIELWFWNDMVICLDLWWWVDFGVLMWKGGYLCVWLIKC